jgi:putative tricarboxylic transport membrane protein
MGNLFGEFISFFQQFHLALYPKLLLASCLGTVLGIIWGAMPALSTTMAMALLIGFSSVMDLNSAIMFLVAVYMGSTSGGSISAIFVNIPGTPAAICTSIEGFALAKKGKGGMALGAAIIASAIGNLFGTLFLVFLFPLVIALAMKFGAWEIFLLAVLGILICGTLTASGTPIKGWISGWIGMLISMIGMDPVMAYPRFTFGINELYGGPGFVPIMIGLFGFAEVMRVLPDRTPYTIPKEVGRVIPSFNVFRRISKTGLRSGLMGSIIGAIPALGPDIAAFASYAVAKKRAPREEAIKYGKGSYDGIAAAETANNACIGGTLLPMLTIGIPGGTVAAMYLGALNLHNVIVGPMIEFNHPGLVHFHYAALLIGATMNYIIMILIAKPTIKLLSTPRQILMPLIVPLCVIGAYASSVMMFDVWIMIFFGIVGFVLNKNGVSLAPMCMGIILGPLADTNFRRAIAIFEGEPPWVVLTRPLGVVILVIVLWVAYDGIFRSNKRRRL